MMGEIYKKREGIRGGKTKRKPADGMVVSESDIFLWVTIGVLTGISQLLAPIHEFGHWLMGADITSWTTAAWKDVPISGPGVLWGYLAEFIFIFCVDLLGTRMGRSFSEKTKKAGNRLRAWSNGYMVILFFTALFSTDFNVHAVTAGASFEAMLFGWIVSAGIGTVIRVKKFGHSYSISFPNDSE